MIAYLKGIVIRKQPTCVIMEVQGVGYEVYTSLYTSNALTEGAEAKAYIHEVIREDTHDLYGFVTETERQLFRLLITVNGVGANTARIMLSSYTPQELAQYIANGNDRALTAIKGIGSKTAQRIVVDLRSKVVTELAGLTSETATETVEAPEQQQVAEEAVQAFITLGYPQPAARKVVAKLLKEKPDMPLNDLIRTGLRMF